MIHPFNHSTSAPNICGATAEPTSPPATDASLGIVYELQAGGALPSIDCSKAVKHVLVSKRFLPRLNVFLRASKHFMRLSFACGLILVCVGSVVNQHLGNLVTLLSALLVFIPIPIAFLALRFDMVMLSVTTYEFWYFSLVSLSSNVLLAMNYGDERALVVLCELLLYEFALLMDANSRGVRSTITASVLGALALLTFVTLQELDLVKDYHSVAQVTYGTWTLESSDVIANGLCNLAMILLRNAYRKWLAFSQLNHERATIRCISYRGRLRFDDITTPRASGAMCSTIGPLVSSVSSISSPSTSSTRQLRLVPLVFKIHADDFIQSWVSLPSAASVLAQGAWAIVGGLGIAGTVALVVINVGGGDHEHHEHRRDHRDRKRHHDEWLAIISVVCTSAYTLRCMCFHNRRLLRHILWSFDFLFLFVQSNVAHVILCHLLQWNTAKCMVVWANWCWFHLVVTLDLLTPVVRRRLGIRSSCLPMVVLVFQVIGHVFLVRELIFSRQWQINDRALLRFTVGEKTVTVFAIPVLLTRMITTFCWCLRLLWRLWCQSKNELILITGAVEYDDYDALSRLREAKQRLTSAREQRLIRQRSI